MKKLIFVLSILLSITSLHTQAQTNPVAFDLSGGNFTFSEWNATNAAGSFPPNMAFHTTTDPSAGSFNILVPGVGDWDCAYNLTSRSRFLGLDNDGIAMISTGNGQFSDCDADAANTDGRYAGAVVAALNTTGRENITISFTLGLVAEGASGRQFNIRLQYRIGTSGNFTDVPGPVEYTSQGNTAGHSQTFSNVVLPAACNNEAVVQVRWIYFQTVDASGSRPQMRVDDVLITSDAQNTVTPQLQVSANSLQAFTTTALATPSAEQSFTVSGSNLTADVTVTAPADFEISLSSGSGFGNNVTIPVLSGSLSATTVYVVYNPQTNNSASGNITVSSTGAADRTVAVSGTVQQVVNIPALCINEFMASNASSIEDENDEFDDWIEIHNSGTTDVDIADFYITDDPSNLTKYQFPTSSTQTLIPAGGFLLVWADNQTAQGDLHTNFALSANGEFIGLVYADGTTIIDSITFGPQTTDVSYGRTTDCGNTWDFFEQHTAGESNISTSVGIHKNYPPNSFNVYPNPSTGSKIYFSRYASVTVTDVLGNVVLQDANVHSIDINEFHKGLYFIKTNDGAVKRIIVQ